MSPHDDLLIPNVPLTSLTYQPITRSPVTAAQWNDDDDSLRLVQALLFPLSPLRIPGHGGKLGIGVGDEQNVLVFVPVGHWLLRDENGIRTMSDEAFRAHYAIVTPEAHAAEPLESPDVPRVE